MKRSISGASMAGAGCIIGSILLFIVLTVTNRAQDTVWDSGALTRAPYGGDEQQYRLLVEGLGADAVSLTVMVKPQVYTEEEAAAAFEQIMEMMEDRIKGENPSLMEVTKPLELPVWLEEYGIRLRWYSPEPELLDHTGNIQDMEE